MNGKQNAANNPATMAILVIKDEGQKPYIRQSVVLVVASSSENAEIVSLLIVEQIVVVPQCSCGIVMQIDFVAMIILRKTAL